MFNVIRTYPGPSCLAKKEYNQPEIVNALRSIFYEKCYLCERTNIQDVEIEHLVPHEGDDALKFQWDNLFYSCSRCNSIKSSKHKDILDCSDNALDIFNEICCIMPSIPDDDVCIEVIGNQPQAINTAELLKECYNLENTALRMVSREALMNELFDYYYRFLSLRKILKDISEDPEEKKRAEGRMKAMLAVVHPFSIFWRWHYLGDKFLVQKYPDLRQGF